MQNFILYRDKSIAFGIKVTKSGLLGVCENFILVYIEKQKRKRTTNSLFGLGQTVGRATRRQKMTDYDDNFYFLAPLIYFQHALITALHSLAATIFFWHVSCKIIECIMCQGLLPLLWSLAF